MTYELWDMSSGNMFDEFSSPGDAVQCVADLLEDGNQEFVTHLSLFGPGATGARQHLADGAAIPEVGKPISTRH